MLTNSFEQKFSNIDYNADEKIIENELDKIFMDGICTTLSELSGQCSSIEIGVRIIIYFYWVNCMQNMHTNDEIVAHRIVKLLQETKIRQNENSWPIDLLIKKIGPEESDPACAKFNIFYDKLLRLILADEYNGELSKPFDNDNDNNDEIIIFI